MQRFTVRVIYALVAFLALSLMSGCGGVLSPAGDIGHEQRNLIGLALGVMALVVVPVISMILYFAWKYRAGNLEAEYKPEWARSRKVEITIWAVPIVIVSVLAVFGWRTAHSLDPYRPLVSTVPPLHVEVVAMDWKWLFVYPDFGIASVNELHLPVNTPVDFKITSDTVMNSFFIPRLGSQIYAMAGMQTQLHLNATAVGTYDGLSANFSGPGFAGMHFQAIASSADGFSAWVRETRAAGGRLDTEQYHQLARPSSDDPVRRYGDVAPGLFTHVLGQYASDASLPPMSAAPMAFAPSTARASGAKP